MNKNELQPSDYRIRKLIGILGVLLPLLLPLANKWHFLSSISHYYYQTLSSLIYIIILSAFGLFLISYKGRNKAGDEKFSDDVLTNIGGFAALVVVFLPTACADCSTTDIIALCKDCNSDLLPLFGHCSKIYSTIHLVAAGIFILCMGWMSKYKFTRGCKVQYERIYKNCGNIVFISVALLIVGLILDTLNVNFLINGYYIYIFETTAIIAFGVSWLIKGEAIENMMEFKAKMMKKIK